MDIGRIDVENPNPPTDVAVVDGVVKKKWKTVGLGAFVLAVIALLIGLGVTLGGTTGSNTDSVTNASSANANVNADVVVDEDGVVGVVPSTESTDVTTTNPEYPNPNLQGAQVKGKQYLTSNNGPIDSRVRIMDPSVADGYESCTDLREDIINAVKYLANSIIVAEAVPNEWYEKCDPNAPYPYTVDAKGDESAFAEPAPASGDALTTASVSAKEDSFATNNQVEGVDEADVVKSDGDFVYAAYGDLLYVWNATDGTKGVSITAMPYEAINLTECMIHNPPYVDPRPIDVYASTETGEVVSSTPNVTIDPVDEARSGGRKLRNRKTTSMMWNPCVQPKPTIQSLLLSEKRITVIVSEQAPWYYGMEAESKPSIIGDSSKLIIRVYDTSSVPTDGSPLTLLGERTVKGYYDSARSVGNTGHIFITSYVDTAQFTKDIYRWAPQYCGLNSTEYKKRATETALNNTKPFVDQMMEELQLYNGDSCESIFHVAAMQSGNSTFDNTYGNVLGSFVQILSFDMSADFNNDMNTSAAAAEIVANVGGAFSSGWVSSVYASQDFAATLSVGSSWNDVSGLWDQSTFILGFDISGAVPKPFSYAEIPGQPLNQYSVDLYQGHLRVVTTEFFWNDITSSTTNKIFVLKVPDPGESPAMLLTGETDHVGKPNEQVMSVRFMESKGYIVTFERKDPLYVFDLSNPSDPKKVGELEVPGFSSYLHPIEIEGIKLMLGVGSNVNETTGWESGLKISLFDVSDPMKLKELAVFVDEGASSSGSWDFKSFRYLPLSQKLILPKSEYTWTETGNFDGFVVYDIALDSIEPRFNIQHASSYDMYSGCWYSAYLPPRSLVFQSKLTTILSHSVISTDLFTGNKMWNLTLKGLDDTICSPYFF